MKTKSLHIIVGMSGGVDSSVAAWLLQQQGHKVEGVFMKNWEADQDDLYCTATQDLIDAQQVCEKLNIPFHSVNFSKQYWDRVFQYFLDECAAGRTPNPDIMCNKEIKFKAFLNYALEAGADAIATGHYARIQKQANAYQLLQGSDQNKDQSYFLYTLGQKQLQSSLFPVGELTKPEVRKIAAELGLKNHNKKDSTGICFIGERKFNEFLAEYLLAQPGNIETEEGNIIGKHNGLMFYTLGQRKGIGIGGSKNAAEEPWFVIDKDIPRKTLIVAQGHDHPRLYKYQLQCTDIHWIAGVAPTLPFNCEAKIRYRQPQQACTINFNENSTYEIKFNEPQRAITPGQSIVFYQGDVCLGGGIIL